jgi:hypothetical protein
MRISVWLNVNVALNAIPVIENAPHSPGMLQYIRDNKKHVQRQAMRDLWLLRWANGGKLPHGAVLAIVA